MADFHDTGSIRITRHCLCGGSLDARSTPPAAARALDEAGGVVHSGEGHGPTDSRGAARARRREEARILAEQAAS